jgi:hypothetical protein
MGERIFTYALAIAVAVATTGFLARSRPTSGRVQKTDIQFAANGAFRDGLFVGKLAAERGEAMHPLPGRWTAEADRISFIAGYQRGYRDVLATAPTTAQNKVSKKQSQN